MKVVETNWRPNDRQLRQFGIVCAIALPLIGWFWGGSASLVSWLAAIGLAIALAGMVLPRAVKPLFLALMIVATPIGMLIGELAMLGIYFVVFLPIGMAFRLRKRDALQLKIDRAAKTYWRPKKQPRSVASYYHQS